MGDWKTRIIRFLTPWYDEEKVVQRERHTEEIRLKSIGARIKAEQVVERFRQTNGILRR